MTVQAVSEIFTINILDANEAGVGPISDTNTDADQVSEDAANGDICWYNRICR